LNYENNEKIQQLGIVLLVDMTEGIASLCENKVFYTSKLTELQEFIANSKLVDHLSSVLADSTSKLKEATEIRNKIQSADFQKEANEDPDEFILKQAELKKKVAEIENKSQQTIELIFVFFKQLFNIYDCNDLTKNSNNCVKLIKKMSQYKIFEAIVFHCQVFETEFYKRLAMNMLELTFFIIREFNIQQIFEAYSTSIQNKNTNNDSQNKPITLLQRLREEEKMQKIQRQAQLPTRHNNFGTTIQVVRPLDKSSYIVTNLSQLSSFNKNGIVTNNKFNEFAEQTHIRKKSMKNKKFSDLVSDEIKFINDMILSDNLNNDLSNFEIIMSIKGFCEDFLKHSFRKLIEFVFAEINKNR